MKRMFALLSVIAFLSCNAADPSNSVRSNESEELDIIIQERIDGPANVRNEPNGRVFLELFNNAKVDASELHDDWFEIVIFAEFKQSDYIGNGFEKTLIKAGRPIIQDGDTIGKFKEDIEIRISIGGVRILGELRGYTHKDNIKKYTIIERAIEEKLTDNERSLANWKPFIKKFGLEDRDFARIENITFFVNSDGVAEMGPSPGPRVVLIFDEQTLIGFFHSRSINIEDTNTIQLERYGSASFFRGYPEKKKKVIIDRLNKWLVYEMN